MQNIRHTDNDLRPLSGLSLEYAPLNPHWLMIYICLMVIVLHCQSITITTGEFVPLIFHKPYNYIILIPYRRKVLCDHYMCFLIDADFKSYTGIPCECPPHVSYWRVLPFLNYEPCKYTFPIAYMKKVYIVGADFKFYLEITCGCSLHASYWRAMPFIFCEPCNCIHIETYWRKVISLFTYIYNSMLFISECQNIFKTLINTVNRTILSNLTISIHV